ncbi:MAGUK p55 subfamily member 4 [Lampris incognitus]|uniref:MAGUK p55 subfamily member 4 n=1 Tax=Lampris incognitus TaxID=2546036 RepID=UPI0024B5FB0A|nr:MAGUK p55 subfamily member 4 [Lampris incognitus]
MITMRNAMEASSSCNDGLSEALSTVLKEVRRAIGRDVNGAELLHELLSAPWLHSLLKVYECLLQFQRLSPSPFLPYASGLSHEIMAVMRTLPNPSADARELYNILRSPHMQALLSSHDSVAQSDYGPVLPALPDSLPEDEEAMRIVCLVKNNQPLGATIKKDEETGEIYIARVIHGGLADRSGLLYPGDLLVEVNGNSVEGMEPEQVIQILIHSQGTILFKVIPNKPPTTSSQTLVFMRAMVDYCPLQDSTIPCPDAGMAFNKGDLLEIVDQTDCHWWQARKLPSVTSCAGLIPSVGMLKSKQREQWWCQTFQTHTCLRPLTSADNEDDAKPADEKCIKADEENIDIDETQSDIIDGIYLAGFRLSFRLWRRTAYRRRRQSCYCCSPNSTSLSNPYEEVVTYQRPPQENHRLIVLVGASGVGVNELRKRLIKLNPSTFQGPVPHTTRPVSEGEQTGREYHFVTKELFEYMVCNHRFLEYGEYKGHLYGTSSDSIGEVLKRGRMCIIDVEPHSIQLLRTKKLKPYIVFIKAPSLERLMQTRRSARIVTNNTVKRPFMEEDFEEMEDSSRLIESKYRQFFDSIVVNDNLQDACMELFSVIQQAQNEPQWLPATWMAVDD